MNAKYSITLKGKVLEVVKPAENCFIRIQIEPFLLEFPCPESCDFHLEDRIILKGEIQIENISQTEILNNHSIKKMEVQDE